MTARTLRRGETEKLVAATTSTTKATISNYGVTVVTTAQNYVLDAPVEGVEKYIVCLTAASSIDNAASVKASTPASSVGTIKVGAAGTTASRMVFGSSAGSGQPFIHLKGYNSTQWLVVGSNNVTFST